MTSRIVVTGGAIIRDHRVEYCCKKDQIMAIGDYLVVVWSPVRVLKKL
ncbi:hypothetical protein ACFVQB_27480 [Paenibacillus sp. NPDC057886]